MFPTADIRGCTQAKVGSNEAAPLECFTPVVNTLITYAFIFLGAACVLVLLYGSIKFITSRGDPKAVTSAKMTMIYAGLGTLLVLSTYIIINVFTNLFAPGVDLLNFNIP